MADKCIADLERQLAAAVDLAEKQRLKIERLKRQVKSYERRLAVAEAKK